MQKIVNFLKSDKPAFIFSILLMITYAINMSILMEVVGHLDLGHYLVDRGIYLITALTIESLILVFIINRMVWVGRSYALFSFVINLLYYNHFDILDTRTFVSSIVLSLVHSGAIFFLADLFNRQTKEDNTCQVCDAKFKTKGELNIHLKRVHTRKQ